MWSLAWGHALSTILSRLNGRDACHHVAIAYILDITRDLTALHRQNEPRRLLIKAEEPHLFLNRLLRGRNCHLRHPFAAKIWSIARSIGVKSFGSHWRVYRLTCPARIVSKASSCLSSVESALCTAMYWA